MCNNCVRKKSGGRYCASKFIKMCEAFGPTHFEPFDCAISGPEPPQDASVVQFLYFVLFALYQGMDSFNCWPLVSAEAFPSVKHFPILTSSAASLLATRQPGTQSLGRHCAPERRPRAERQYRLPEKKRVHRAWLCTRTKAEGLAVTHGEV